MRADIALIYGFLRCLSVLPLRALHAMGTGTGWLLWRLNTRATQTARTNIKLVCPHTSAKAQEHKVRHAMQALGQSIFEMAWVWGRHARRTLKQVREIHGLPLFEKALADNKGVIIAAPHLGCWELLNYWLCAHTEMAILYRPPRIAALEPLLRKVRGDLAPEQVRAEGAGVRTLFKRLAKGGTIGILPDQKPRHGEGQMAPFFGHDAATMVLLPRLAARTKATVLFAFCERLPRGRGFRLHFIEAPDDLDNQDTTRACSALNQGVARCVQQAFAQYQWTYRRFSGHGLENPYTKSPSRKQ